MIRNRGQKREAVGAMKKNTAVCDVFFLLRARPVMLFPTRTEDKDQKQGLNYMF